MKPWMLCMAGLILLAACSKKTIPEGVDGVPVFYFRGEIGGVSTTLEAGEYGLYHFTDYYKDTQNILTVKSLFAPQSNPENEPYLCFEFRDMASTVTGTALAGSIQDMMTQPFHNYSLDSVVSTTNVETFHFIPESNMGSFSWDFGDGTTSTMSSPSHVFTSGGIRNVQLIHSVQGLTDTVSNLIDVSLQSSCRPQFDMSYDTLTNTIVVSVANPVSANYAWDFGDGVLGNGSVYTHAYQNNGIFHVKLTMTGGGCGIPMSFEKKVNFSSIGLPYLASYSYTTSNSTITHTIPRLNTSSLVITYKKDGQTYTSFKQVKGINQTGNIDCSITSMEPYSNNEKGYKTIRIGGSISAWLYNKNNNADSIRLVSENLSLGIAYP